MSGSRCPYLAVTVSALLLGLACDVDDGEPGAVAPRYGLCAGYEDACGQDACGHRTQSQHAWGAVCTGDSAACRRDKGFEDVFPEGLYVGCGALTTNLLNAAAVEKALPSSGLPRKLTASEAGAFDGVGDPKVGTALFGQVVALTLNVAFNDIHGFSQFAPTSAFRDLVITAQSSPCRGMDVFEVLVAANAALGGCSSPLSPQVAHDCVAALNTSFINGETVEGDELCSPLFATD